MTGADRVRCAVAQGFAVGEGCGEVPGSKTQGGSGLEARGPMMLTLKPVIES